MIFFVLMLRYCVWVCVAHLKLYFVPPHHNIGTVGEVILPEFRQEFLYSFGTRFTPHITNRIEILRLNLRIYLEWIPVSVDPI